MSKKPQQSADYGFSQVSDSFDKAAKAAMFLDKSDHAKEAFELA
jgi:hypothetical protein